MADEIFTQEQHESLLESAVRKAVEEATKAVDGELLKLNERVEAAESDIEERDAKIAERDTKIAELQAKIDEREEADRLAAVADERAKLVLAEVKFTDEQVEARKMAWAQMEDEAFDAYVEDLKAISKPSKQVPSTKFDGTRAVAELETSAVQAFFDSDVVV